MIDTAVDSPLGRLRVILSNATIILGTRPATGEIRNDPKHIDTTDFVKVYGVEYRVRLECHSDAWLNERIRDGKAAQANYHTDPHAYGWVMHRSDGLVLTRTGSPAPVPAGSAAHQRVFDQLFPFISRWATLGDGRRILENLDRIEAEQRQLTVLDLLTLRDEMRQ